MEFTGKKILVTGGNGFLGQQVVAQLIERGASKELIFTPRSKELNLVKWEDCQKAVQGRDLVIHLAAVVGGIGANLEHPGKFFYENLMMGVQLMEAARQEGVKKFVAIGTVCAYPKFTPVPFKEEDIWNGYPEETNAPYGLAKKMLLVQSQSYRQEYGFNSIFLLPVNLYGPGDNFDPESSHVIPALIRKVAEAKKHKQSFVELWGTGAPTREFLYVEDAARAIAMAAQSYEKSDPINLGSGVDMSIQELIALISRLMNFKGEVRWDSARPDGQPRRKLDVTKAKKEFGFTAQMPFEEGLKKTIEWYLSQ